MMVNDYTNLDEFKESFNIVDNALDMRDLRRWNGRNLGKEENLAEHTHLVVACMIELIDMLYDLKVFVPRPYTLVKAAMLHDSVEIFRGDILTITKDAIPGLREQIDLEENEFYVSQGVSLGTWERKLLKLADLKACYKFLERVMQTATNDFVHNAYVQCVDRYNAEYIKFLTDEGVLSYDETILPQYMFEKGYGADAACDVVLLKDVTFLPMSTQVVDLDVRYTPEEGTCALLVARTSAAVQGLNISMCPIDANYTGTIKAIVHNISNDIITYQKGESFCQLMVIKVINESDDLVKIKREGKRSDGWNGSTDKE